MRDLSELPGYLIRRLHQASVSIFVEDLGEVGHSLTPVQFAALNATRFNPGTDQATLAGMIAYDRTTIGGVIDRLVQKGLMERVVSTRDRRARELRLSDAGEAVLDSLYPLIVKIQGEILAGLDESEQQAFLVLLKKAVDGVNDRSRAPLRLRES
ncbi:MarR family winged helix-turn-helix transcriptional regulator [Halodurantibacterium flavum]|uniref:MarR family winged helix-turn-helix transcriptional regulator n=1 Tax=Halodurantibacterium flavum TaxID=1382802 RepID=A0ABW4S8L1_9RHOB